MDEIVIWVKISHFLYNSGTSELHMGHTYTQPCMYEGKTDNMASTADKGHVYTYVSCVIKIIATCPR